MLKNITFCSTIIAMACAASISVHAVADTPKAIDVPAGELTVALRELARQSGVEFVYSADQLKGVRTTGVHGEYTAETAVTKLLEGTKLKLTVHPSGALLISDAATSGSLGSALGGDAAAKSGAALPWSRESTGNDSQGRIRLVQIEGSAASAQSSETSAPTADQRRGQLEEIVVTAQKREERLQDVPISISVLSGVELDKSTVEGVSEALSRVPGTAVNVTYQGGGTQVIMRGVSAGGPFFNGSSPVSYYLDSVPFSFVRQAIAPDTNAYDLERVEVLRGPQGTLYGASAQNGVVRVLTKDANPDRFELKARTSASGTSGGGENYRGDMAINVPLIEGKLAARAVLGYQDMGGWIDRPNKSDVNDAQISNARLKLNAELTDQLSIGLSGWISRADYGGPSTSNDSGRQLSVLDEPIATDLDTYALKVGYDSAAISISSMTSYLEYVNHAYRSNYFVGPDVLSDGFFEATVFSQEVVLNSNRDGLWRWSLGGMYRDADDLQFQRNLTPSLVILNDQVYTSESFAVFGELSRKFLDDTLELTGGLRYFEDDVTSRFDLRDARGSGSFDALSPRVVLTWLPSDDLTAYASYSEGFRSGFPQSGLLLSVAPYFPSVKPDTLHNYEIGAKGKLWEGRLSFDTALYYIDWTDVQQSLAVPVPLGLTTAQINSESASGIGFDIGVTARPLDGLEIGFNASLNNLEMDRDLFAQASATSSVLLFGAGDRLSFSPEYILGGWTDYTVPLGRSGYQGQIAVSANYTSAMDVRTIAAGARNIAYGDATLIVRASFEISSPESWTTTLFVDNLNNERGSPVRFPFLTAVKDWDGRVRPRTIGVQLDYHF